jgi:phage shock protein PspC (stress-responsive transcriptional regulator)
MIPAIQNFFEQNAFGVCSHLGEKLGIASASVRMWFIYASFLTFGSPVVLYFAMAFVMEFRKHLRRGRSTVWDM